MGRRIRWLGLALVVCFALVLFQLTNIQFRQANALANSPDNPRTIAAAADNPRGDILAANGQVLATSVKASGQCGGKEYQRTYPASTASLFADVVGYDSPLYGTFGVEYEYNAQLSAHQQPPASLGQLLGGAPTTTDNVTLTLSPSLQALAASELAGRDGAVVVLDPSTGAIEAMYANPTYDPNLLASPSCAIETQGRQAFLAPDAYGFSPQSPLTYRDDVAPGSTFKVVTTTAVYNLDPSLSNFVFPPAESLKLPNSNQVLNNDGDTVCGGTIAQMLPVSCDPGYGALGLTLGGATLSKQAQLFGFDSVPPIDLPDAVASYFPPASSFTPNDPFAAYDAIGQEDVRVTALQNALDAAAVADNGTIMTPHVMAEITGSQGNIVTRYTPTVWRQAMSAQAASQVNTLMQTVVSAGDGTAHGCFPASLDVAAKTGTAQAPLNGVEYTDDWMIAFAPANDPKVAVAAVVPFQSYSATGAAVAGPILNAMISAALGVPAGPSC